KQFFSAINSLPRCKKMAGQDLLFADPAVGEKPVCRLGRRPILTGEGDAPPHAFGQLLHQRTQPFLQPRIRQRRGRQFLLDPVLAATRLRPDCPLLRCSHDSSSQPPQPTLESTSLETESALPIPPLADRTCG